MESLISDLVSDFEKGRITRRRLIQTLALLAAGAPAGTAAAAVVPQAPSSIPPQKEPASWKTVWLDHISYAVSDYRRSTAFYRDLMGWDIKTDEGTRQCTLKIGTIGEIIIRNGRQPAASSTPGQSGRPPLTGVINHISWGIEPWNTENVEKELKRRGLEPRPDMVGDSFKSFHVIDPDGWDLQISNQTSSSRG
jgi:catechol 2,3-dioxygenase-like lactoylglutathione lyase family enzyme